MIERDTIKGVFGFHFETASRILESQETPSVVSPKRCITEGLDSALETRLDTTVESFPH